MTIERKLREALHTMPTGFTQEVRNQIVKKATQPNKRLTNFRPYLTVAAGLCFCALLAGGFLLRIHPSAPVRMQTPTVGQKNSQPPSSLMGGSTIKDWAAYLQFQMVNQSVGWSIADQGTQVVRTTDGGKSWRDVSPIKSSAANADGLNIIASDFFNDSEASVVVASSNSVGSSAKTPATVYTTSDGGQHWLASKLNLPSSAETIPISIDFLDARWGWVMVGVQGRSNVVIFHTSDGGAHWSQVSTTGTGSVSLNGLPVKSDKIGMTFVSDTVGFVSLLHNPSDNAKSPLFETKDGGKTWEAVSLKLPNKTYDFGRPPVFQSSSTGTFDLEYLSPNNASVFYSTNNGGQSWTQTGQLKYEVPQGQQFAIPDILSTQDIFVVAGGKLHVSHDGGRTWHSYPIKSDIHLVSFVTPQIGWAVGLQGQLYKTVDGGATWKKMSPVVLPK